MTATIKAPISPFAQDKTDAPKKAKKAKKSKKTDKATDEKKM